MSLSRLAIRCGRMVLAASAAALSLHAASVRAADFEPLPVEAYVKPAEFAQVSMSRNGRYIAALAPLDGFRNIVIVDLDTMKTRAITGLKDMDVVRFRWVGSQYLVFETGKIDTPRGIEFNEEGGLFSVRLDGTNFRKLAGNLQDAIKQGGTSWTRMDFMRAVPGSENAILVASNFRQAHEFDVYRVDLDSGKLDIQTFERPTNVYRWILDHQGVPRVAVKVRDREALEDDQITTVLYREALDKPWREVLKYQGVEQAVAPWLPRAIAPNGNDLIVEARVKDGVSALHRYDVQTGQLAEKLVSSPRHDASETQLNFGPEGQLLSASTRDETHSTVFFDKSLAALHTELSAVFPGKKVGLQRAEGGRTLVTVWSDRLPQTVYLFDEATAKLRLVLRSRPDMSERNLVEARPFLLKTRDGLEIPSYYFLPASYQPGQKLPTVVHIHGGPMVRADHWGPLESTGFVEAQVLASRGYAVVVPNFRVTPGFGAKIYFAGFGEVGRKMSDDHEDAARWAVQQGFADADRICISGSSYGGYASLWASIRSADVFRCAMPGLLVSDMRSQLKTSDIRRSRSGVDYWKRLLGVKGDDWSAADEVSPLRYASRSAIPLFIWAGGNDERTPLSETENMVDALQKAGKPVDTLMIKAGEAHGYGLRKNRVELYETMLKFLDRQIGSGWKK